MTDFNKILEKAKEIEKKMKESQENLKKIEVEGMSGGDAVKITLNMDFTFEYWEDSSPIECRVSGKGSGIKLMGRISCVGWHDAMRPRPATIVLGAPLS